MRPNLRVILWGIAALIGGMWTLQGFDVFGQDGGMNGRSAWIGIGLLTLVGGALMAIRAARSSSV